ncbi:hypothetical protein [Frankia tisae]|nr:hypothetical protein [Frankia tisae]
MVPATVKSSTVLPSDPILMAERYLTAGGGIAAAADHIEKLHP